MISRKSIWQALKRNDLTGQADAHGQFVCGKKDVCVFLCGSGADLIAQEHDQRKTENPER